MLYVLILDVKIGKISPWKEIVEKKTNNKLYAHEIW